MLYNKDSVETSQAEMSEESQDTVESASPNRESLCSTMTPGIDAKINDVIKQNPAYGLNMLALGEMVSQRFLVPLFEVRVLEGQPRSFGVVVNTSACHAEDHGFESRKDRQKDKVNKSICLIG